MRRVQPPRDERTQSNRKAPTSRQLGLICLAGIAVTAAFLTHAGGVNPKIIYGRDTRRDIRQIQEPWLKDAARATAILVAADRLTPSRSGSSYLLETTNFGPTYNLCPTERYYHQPVLGHCSGVLIAPDLLATASHCVPDEHACTQVRIAFDFAVTGRQMPRSLPQRSVYRCLRIVHQVDEIDGDVAVIQLEREASDRIPIAIETEPQRGITPGAPLTVLGYPAGIPLKVAHGQAMTAVEESVFAAAIDTYEGNSGSPVLDTRSRKLVGLLTGGNYDWVEHTLPDGRSCYRSRHCLGNDCTGENVSSAELLRPALYPTK